MIHRRLALSFILILAILWVPLVAEGQQAGKVPRIGWLGGPTRESAEPFVQAFQRGLKDLGWVEGQNIVIEWRFAGGRAERLPDLAAEMVRLQADVIVAPSTPTALAAKNATKAIPIVTVAVGDPVGLGLVASLARPGGNITGLTSVVTPEMAGKQLALLKETAPKISRVAVLWNPATPGTALSLRQTEVASLALGVQLQPLEARSLNDFASAFAAMTTKRVGALLVLGDVMFATHRIRLADLATKSRLPAMYTLREYVEAGGLMSYGPINPELFRRAATYVDKILKGTKPADLPVEQPTKFELVINLKTAKALGLTLLQSVLIRADELIQ
jgi:putative ABC transport system substrate-binding protein